MRKSAPLDHPTVLILARQVRSSPSHVELARHLAANPSVGRHIAKLSPHKAAVAIRQLEASLTAPEETQNDAADTSMTNFVAAHRAAKGRV